MILSRSYNYHNFKITSLSNLILIFCLSSNFSFLKNSFGLDFLVPSEYLKYLNHPLKNISLFMLDLFRFPDNLSNSQF